MRNVLWAAGLIATLGLFVSVVVEILVARRSTQNGFRPNAIGIVVANSVSMLLGWPVIWLILVALQTKFLPHGLLWPASPLREVASVTLEAPWLTPYSQHDFYWKSPVATMVLLIPAFCTSIFLEFLVIGFFWRSKSLACRFSFILRVNAYSFSLLFLITCVWLVVGIVGHRIS